MGGRAWITPTPGPLYGAAAFLRSLPPTAGVFDWADRLGSDVRAAYWEKAPVFLVQDNAGRNARRVATDGEPTRHCRRGVFIAEPRLVGQIGSARGQMLGQDEPPRITVIDVRHIVQITCVMDQLLTLTVVDCHVGSHRPRQE
jgi:hypothetical protein